MNNKKETIVFIDAGYLSLISKFLGKGKHLKFNIGQFAEHLATKENLKLNKTFYYTAPPYQGSAPRKDEIERKANYDKFINKLRKIPNFVVREGRCQKIDNVFMQKGVDTLLTMDIFEVVHKKDVGTIILLACDTDFVPVLNRIREEGIKVILCYFSDFDRKSKFFMSNHILTACDKKILLKKQDFDNSLI
ncbi:MAG: NYN domain-containing protein [Candidatus Aenigmatarchaeota archaeon]